MDDVYDNIDDYNPKRKRKILIVFDDMIADIMTNKTFQAIIRELFVRCRKLNISLVFITQSYFSVPKEVRLNSTHYLVMKIHNKRELQQIAINHSGDINYKDFLKILYKEYSRFSFIKMTLTEQVKILDDKIKANQAQYDLYREAAKISALFSKELDKYENLTGEDLGYKPDIIQKAKFEYSPLGETFNKVFKKDDKNKKVIKYNNHLPYSSVHNFSNYSVSNFNEISSIDSKFDTINKFYKDLLKLRDVKSQNRNTKQKYNCVKKMHHLL